MWRGHMVPTRMCLKICSTRKHMHLYTHNNTSAEKINRLNTSSTHDIQVQLMQATYQKAISCTFQAHISQIVTHYTSQALLLKGIVTCHTVKREACA